MKYAGIPTCFSKTIPKKTRKNIARATFCFHLGTSLGAPDVYSASSLEFPIGISGRNL